MVVRVQKMKTILSPHSKNEWITVERQLFFSHIIYILSDTIVSEF